MIVPMIVDGKALSLHEMIARYVMPGTVLHLAGGIGGPSAAITEIIRQFRGKNPGFTLVQSTVTGHAINLLHLKLVKKAIFAACADISTSGRPSRIMQRAWAEKDIELENWSLASLQQRLMAGALGVGFLPTRSVTGSSIGEANSEAFSTLTDPFSGETAGAVKALNPDVSIVHGCIADEYGNTVLPVPYGEDIWGPLAAGTVLVTVERIVPAKIIHEHAALVKLPGHAVTAVAAAPRGLHPFSLAAPMMPEELSYETDLPFLTGLHQAFGEDGLLNEWLEEWVFGLSGHDAYLRKLGKGHLESLSYAPVVQKETEATTEPADGPVTAEETVLVAAGREIERCIRGSGHKTILVGAGNRAAAVLLAYYRLQESGYRIDIITGNGQVEYEPKGGALGTQGVQSVYESTMLTDTVTSLGVLIGGERNRCLSVLGVGQIDKHGNTNSTIAANGQFLVGSGGANDAANAREVLVIVNQSKERFPEELPYITCPGMRITTVVTDMGIFRKETGSGELRLAACLPDADMPDLGDRIQRIRDNCGWDITMADNIEDIAGPTVEELALLRRLVPARPAKK